MMEAQNELANRMSAEMRAKEGAWQSKYDAERKQNEERVQVLERQLNEEKQAGVQKVQALEKRLEDERNAAAEKLKVLEEELSKARQVTEEKVQELMGKLAAFEAEKQLELAKFQAVALRKDALSRRSAGTFSTLSVRSWDRPKENNRFSAKFSQPSLTPPRAIIGLNLFDLSSGANIRLKADIERVTNEGIDINLHSWADTAHYSSGCAWMQIPSEDTDIQIGQFSTEEDHPWQDPKEKTSKRINFSRPYDATPTVVVWLNGLDVDRNANCRVKVYATDIPPDGFTIHVDTWADTRLYVGRAGWMAFPSSRKDICAGEFSTNNTRPWNQPRHDNRSSIGFGKEFNAPPKMFVALNALDIDRTRNFRVRIGEGTVFKDRYDWSLESWADTIFYMGEASFIAFDNSSI